MVNLVGSWSKPVEVQLLQAQSSIRISEICLLDVRQSSTMSAPYETGESSSNALSNVQAIPPAWEAASKESAWKIAIPSNFLILPPAAATLGLVIGMTRGGRIARLRFLAENVHRQPTTYQGWVCGFSPRLIVALPA